MQTILANFLLCILVILFILVSIDMIKNTFFNSDKEIKKEQNKMDMYNVWITSLTNSLPSYIDGGTITPKKDDFVNSLLHQKDTKIFELEMELSLLKQKSIRFEKDSINKRYSIVECIEHQVLLLDANVIKPTDVLNLIKKIKNNISTELPKQ